MVQVWETQLYNQTQAAPASFDERRTLREFDCEHRAVRTKDVVSYRGGQVVANQAAGGGWAQLAPAPIQVGASSNLNTAYDNQTIANAVADTPRATAPVAKN